MSQRDKIRIAQIIVLGMIIIGFIILSIVDGFELTYGIILGVAIVSLLIISSHFYKKDQSDNDQDEITDEIYEPVKDDNDRERDHVVERCDDCNSSNIRRGLKQGDETIDAGFVYKSGPVLNDVEPVYCDICEDCGKIIRPYVKTTNRNWVKKKELKITATSSSTKRKI